MSQNTTATSATSEELFDAALQITRRALSEDDAKRFRKFKDHSEMVRELMVHVRRYTGSSPRLLECAERVASFSNAFAPFFDVVGVLVQAKPEWAAVFWGVLLFVFKVRHLPTYPTIHPFN